MLTNEDVQKLMTAFTSVFATREEVATKEDLEKVNAKVDSFMNMDTLNS